ncbi:MAG TPA: polyprenol phosphomannose-dependent alpha 1,6 mannosyltransferase MptB [Pseudonocardiaceae bacterium]|jgi:alpha-1,6-mannosyltransferase|nr:polyprenol phosphomannose-dependent alpha 1,6 mannosyltransferase MptB [Pseudonocardiaceae bacterium]
MEEVDKPASERASAEDATTPVLGETAPLDTVELRQLKLVRRFGVTGALLLAAGSLGASASPVFNPLVTTPFLGLFVRMPTVELACALIGMAMIVVAWLWLGRFVRPGRPRLISSRQLYRTMITWAAPLLVVPPMFSRDVYSYLAQSKIAALGLDPYKLGPVPALGVSDPLTRGVDSIWRDTPAPYGPLFLYIGRWLNALSGDHVVTGVYLQRLLELVGIAMIMWAVPRLARRFGVQPVSALWLGAANPLLIWHLLIGVHNEALMIGLMLAGFEIALIGLPTLTKVASPPSVTRREILWLLAGVAVITLGVAVKLSALPTLGFLGVLVARRWGGRLRHLVWAALVVTGVFVVLTVIISVGTGLGFGWVNALSNNGIVLSWESPVTAVGFLAGGLGIVLGLGNHTLTTVGVMRWLGEIISVLVAIRLLWSGYRGRIHPMIGLGLALGTVALLSATVQPWYLLWAIVPLAASVNNAKFRTATAVVSAAYGMVTPLPTGGPISAGYVGIDAYVAAAIVFAIVLLLVRRRIPIFRDNTIHPARPELAGHLG